MKILRNNKELTIELKKVSNLGFVPTMGGLHKGHLSLIKKSKLKSKKTIVSIYVNHTQFNSRNDYLKYPRNIIRDINLLKKNKVDYLFLPQKSEIYKKKRSSSISIPTKYKVLCAKYRKGHFEGVLDIIDRLLNLINPKYLFLGRKDFQQFFLIKNFVKKNYKTKVILCNTIRDKNYIALSTRNSLLKKNDLKIMQKVCKKINKIKKIIKNNNKLVYLIKLTKKQFIKENKIKIEYFEARNENNLSIFKKGKKFRIFIAYYIKKIRLIDNF
jgi:pantoate--beta-alanine ligase